MKVKAGDGQQSNIVVRGYAFFVACPSLASYPGSYSGEEKEPGTHCLRMCLIAVEFHGVWILS